MSHFDDIYEIAADGYGVVTAAEAHDAGIKGVELHRWTKNGWLDRLGYGVYRLVRWVPTGKERYAEALALVGPGSVLWGESVLALLGLAYVNPGKVFVVPSGRMRRNIPVWIAVVPTSVHRTASYEGIACQELSEAISSCRSRVLKERLQEATKLAWDERLIAQEDYERLEKELR